MVLLKWELRRGRTALLVWTLATAALIAICVLMFPEMQTQMDGVTDLFANMGSFTAAFGMDRLNFGELMGFYGVECGNVLGIGGGLFAAFLGISALSREEKERTAEFLLSHPISRQSVLWSKLLAVQAQVLGFNLVNAACGAVAIVAIGERVDWQAFWLLHLAFWILQVEIACFCFGLSAFLRRGGVGIGLGLAALLYFLNLLHNLSERAEFLRYCTPFAYAEASNVVAERQLDLPLILLGLALGALLTLAGFVYYSRKDITA